MNITTLLNTGNIYHEGSFTKLVYLIIYISFRLRHCCENSASQDPLPSSPTHTSSVVSESARRGKCLSYFSRAMSTLCTTVNVKYIGVTLCTSSTPIFHLYALCKVWPLQPHSAGVFYYCFSLALSSVCTALYIIIL